MFNETYDMTKVQQTMQPELYQKVLHQYIKGVIFVRSDLFELLFPQFTQKIRERQFINASIDIIRKEVRGNKKELYIKEVKEYFHKNKTRIIKNTINKFDEIANNQYITFYLSNVSSGILQTLTKHKLTNIFDEHHIYFRDTNTSYNKIDGFITKHIQIIDERGNIKKDTKQDIIDIKDLENGKYSIFISYTFEIPESYKTYIKQLEDKYQITITDREMAILGLKPGIYEESGFGKVKKRRETKATIYLP